MQVHRDLGLLPSFRQAVITIGTFDGVHRGHQEILHQLNAEANRIGGESVIVSFDPHPRKVIGPPGKSVGLINTLEEKTELLAAHGVDHLVILPFTETFAKMSARAYVQEFLVAHFHPHTLIIGYDHRFGQGRQGDYRLLEDLGMEFGYQVKEIPAFLIDSLSVSSTRIREAIMQGDTGTANSMLGYSFFFQGTVVSGDRRGREIGFPTANLIPDNPEKIVPGNGVYAVGVLNRSISDSQRQKGMMNIGLRPTFGAGQRHIEVHILDFAAEIYGATLRVYVEHWLRGEKKFDGIQSLKDQLEEDRHRARELLA